MAKDPIFPLYYNDFLGATRTWTDEEVGAYLRLLMEQWDKGYVPNDFQRLSRIVTSIDSNWAVLKDKFKETPQGLQNPVLEEIRLKRIKFKNKQKENIEKRYQKSTKEVTRNLPLEVEIENETLEIKNNSKDDNEYLKFINMFNSITGKKCKPIEKVRKAYFQRKKEDFSYEDFAKATYNCFNDDYHQKNKHYLTPEFITRPDKLEMYLNAPAKEDAVKVIKLDSNRTMEENNKLFGG